MTNNHISVDIRFLIIVNRVATSHETSENFFICPQGKGINASIYIKEFLGHHSRAHWLIRLPTCPPETKTISI
jgi:hypothetical protein